MAIANRFESCLLLLLLLAVPAAWAAAEPFKTPMGKTADHAWTNPGKVLPCEFRPGTLTVTGLIHSTGCNPNHDTRCGLSLEVLSIKEDSVRGFLAHDPEGRCRVKMEDGRKRVIGPMWRKSEEGDQLVRVTGVMTDGVLHVSRFRVLGGTEGL